MKDREWRKKIEDEINGLKDRVRKFEGNYRSESPMNKIIELAIEWPEVDIGGLHFNTQKTHGIFELKDDGCYYSQDVLICSARDTDEETGRDLLSEYLDSEVVKDAFLKAIENYTAYTDTIKVFIPEKNQGVKKYNGVTWGYWLQPPYSGSTYYFCSVNSSGAPGYNYAYYVLGVAPAFRINKRG
jgi:hypothetical protein